MRSKDGRTQFAPTEITNPIGKLDLTTTIHFTPIKKLPVRGAFFIEATPLPLLHLSINTQIRCCEFEMEKDAERR